MTAQNGLNDSARRYISGWDEMMVDIWQERIRALGIIHTGTLYRSVRSLGVRDVGSSVVIPHSFVEYGIYVDAGVGKGFRRGNGGDLGFTPLRQPRPWLMKKYYASFFNLREAMAELTAREAIDRITAEFR